MTFDHNHKPNRTNLSAHIAALMDRVFYERRGLGFNVQFLNEGRLDEWSFNNRERAEGFAASLERQGREFAFSA